MVGRTKAVAAVTVGAGLATGSAAWANANPSEPPAAGQAGWIMDGTARALSPAQHVIGTGLKVDHWFTTADGGYGKCTHAFFDIYRPGNPVSHHNPDRTINGPRICSGDGGGVFYDYVTDPNGTYSDRTWLCNGWTQSIIVGYPCAEVHS